MQCVASFSSSFVRQWSFFPYAKAPWVPCFSSLNTLHFNSSTLKLKVQQKSICPAKWIEVQTFYRGENSWYCSYFHRLWRSGAYSQGHVTLITDWLYDCNYHEVNKNSRPEIQLVWYFRFQLFFLVLLPSNTRAVHTVLNKMPPKAVWHASLFETCSIHSLWLYPKSALVFPVAQKQKYLLQP